MLFVQKTFNEQIEFDFGKKLSLQAVSGFLDDQHFDAIAKKNSWNNSFFPTGKFSNETLMNEIKRVVTKKRSLVI